MEELSPFPVTGYYGPSLFCDREEETKRLLSNINSRVNTTLLSVRRQGKTGLLFHLFNKIHSANKVSGVYVDIYGTQNIHDFTSQLTASILKAFPEKKSIGKKFLELIKGFHPTIGFDPLNGLPEVSFNFSRPSQYESSITSLFSFLESQQKRIVIAFDEFQQIGAYPEKNMEAFLRTLIQPLKNISFIFSGSDRHMLAEMFTNTKRPFFSSTDMLYLGPIPKEKYQHFIKLKFKEHKRKINEESLEFITSWTRLHTYYTQALCNRLYNSGEKSIELNHVKRECDRLLKEHEPIYFQYRNLLTETQWKVLIAFAKEDTVYQPTSSSFISKYNLGTPANIQRALESLINKEMIYQIADEKGRYYKVYDCFLSRWMERL